MEIDPRLTASALRLTTPSPDTSRWLAGQVVNARAVGDQQGDLVALQIGNRIYNAQISFAVNKGDQLLLEVIRAEPTPLLRPVSAAARADPLQTLLLTDLPRQGGLTPLLARLAGIAAPGGQFFDVSPPILQATRQFFGALLDGERVRDPGRLRSALGDAGTLLEARLAEGARTGQTPPLAHDLKAGLLRLLQALQPETTMPAKGAPVAPGNSHIQTLPLLPPLDASQPQAQPRLATAAALGETMANFLGHFRSEVESALARIQLQQLGSLPGNDPNHLVWLLELPIRHGAGADLWQLRIEREPEGNQTPAGDSSNKRNIWNIRLAFDLAGLGPVHGHIRQQAEQISVRFWAEQPDTVALFQLRLGELRASMQAAGVSIGDIHCHRGSPPEYASAVRQSLVDDQA